MKKNLKTKANVCESYHGKNAQITDFVESMSYEGRKKATIERLKKEKEKTKSKILLESWFERLIFTNGEKNARHIATICGLRAVFKIFTEKLGK